MNRLLLIGIAALAIIGVGWWFISYSAHAPSANNAYENEVRTVVQNFGQSLKSVPLLASADVVSKAMDTAYSGTVDKSLIEVWKKDPEHAPGRTVSSPSPDHIEIDHIAENDETTYVVVGRVIEVTSADSTGTGNAAERPITLILEKQEPGWRIISVTEGGYRQ